MSPSLVNEKLDELEQSFNSSFFKISPFCDVDFCK